MQALRGESGKHLYCFQRFAAVARLTGWTLPTAFSGEERCIGAEIIPREVSRCWGGQFPYEASESRFCNRRGRRLASAPRWCGVPSSCSRSGKTAAYKCKQTRGDSLGSASTTAVTC